MKTNDKDFAKEVASVVRDLRRIDDMKKVFIAAAYIYRERKGKMTQYLEAVDEAWDDAGALLTYISTKELGFD